jgi:hypothetical protein
MNCKKKFVSVFLSASLFLGTSIPVFCQQNPDFLPMRSDQQSTEKTIQGNVNYTEVEENKDLFTGQVEAVQKGATLKMTVSSVISNNFHRKGDQFFAEVTDDFATQSGIVIPSGTVAHGTVTEMKDQKRLGRDAYITIKFDYLITPDSRKIPIEATMTTKRSAAGATAKVVLEDTAYTAAGGVIGGILALKFFGLGGAAASHGYTVAGGAGVGALLGLTASLVRKGHGVLIQPGDTIKVKVNESIDLPVMNEKALRDDELVLDGLDVKILNYIVEKDPFGELNTITLGIVVNNKTNRTFSTFDMALLSDYNTVYYASPFGDTDMWFQKMPPNSDVRGNLSFAVDNPKKRHWLVFYDSRTRKPLAKFSLKNVQREIEQARRKK